MKLPLRTTWHTLTPREKTAVGLMCLVVLLATIWWVLLAPALKTLNSAPARKAQLQADLQKMQSMAKEIETLRKTARPLPNQANALTTLQTITTQLFGNNAKVTPQGETITVSLTGVGGQALASWLQTVRLETGLRQRDIRITLQASPLDGAGKEKTARGWHGQVVLSVEAGGGS